MDKLRLRMSDITKTFPGVKALNSVRLELKPASVHALIGENGAGKSTLMKCLYGLYRQDYCGCIYSKKAADRLRSS